MTREQFLSGVSFKVKGYTYKGAETFYYDECIVKESRSSLDEKIMYTGHHANVTKVGRVGFTAFTFVMDKKVVVKYRFEDLIEFILIEEQVEDIVCPTCGDESEDCGAC